MAGHECKFGAVVCIDFRFRDKMASFLEDLFGTARFDFFSWPGAAKKIADESTRAGAIADIAVCIDKHEAERLVIISHTDCGAYGGSSAFASKEEEIAKLSQDLRTSRDELIKNFPDLSVELYLYDKDEDKFVTITD